MFPWNIAKSAERMFSRWAMKRVCKFLLKKTLGQFILGEIDLDQLDVQLHVGTIQLSDLALNVDFLNQKVEVDELELLLIPCAEHVVRTNEEASTSDQGRGCVNKESVKLSHESGEDCMGATMDIREGVKTVARMVKWLLTSFHVKVKRLIVAYDPNSNRNWCNLGICPNLVLRDSEIECGTCVPEDDDSESGSDAQNILGISCLTNFFTFQGSILELLLIDDVKKQSAFPGVEAQSVEQSHMPDASSITTTIITGEGSGFSGTMKFYIPWKDGSLDTHRVDSIVAVDPILLRTEPNTIKWILMLWDSFKAHENDHQQSTNSVYYSASSQLFSSTFGSTVNPAGKLSSIEECLPSGSKSSRGKEQGASCMLPASLLISDWVPSSVNGNQNRTYERYEGLDFGSSVEQLFECFDGLRSSQNALASSGIISWTCSVFNAIKAASNLASGSYYMPPERKHVEANVRITIASISMVFCLHDDNCYESCNSEEDRTKDSASCQYLVTDVQRLLLDFQKFEIFPVLLRVDYTPRGVDLPALGGGKYAELVNSVPWKGIEIQLKHVHAVGIYGLNSICDRIVGEWLQDISQNQIHKLLQGLPTIRSLVSVGYGASKLVTSRLKNYRKDHKLVKGMERGSIAFLRSISLEAVALGVHLAAEAHDILVQAEYILSHIPLSESQPAKGKENDYKFLHLSESLLTPETQRQEKIKDPTKKHEK